MARPVRIGVLGCARITTAALIEPAAVVAGVTIAAVASRDAGRAAAYAATHGIARAHGSYGALIDDTDLDAIYNPLPNSLHASWSIAALAAGKAVLCEKPVAANAAEAGAMADASARYGRPLVEAFHYRYHPLAQRARALVADGAVGRVRSIDARFCIPSGRVRPDNIRFRYDLAGGATMDLGSYCVNALRLLGNAEPAVRGATATLYRSPAGVDDGQVDDGQVDDGQVDVAMEAALDFPDGVMGTLRCSLADPAFDARLLVVGDEGTLEVRNPFQPQRGNLLTLRRGGGAGGGAGGGTGAMETVTEEVETTPTFVFQLREFAAVVADGLPIRTPVADGVANMTVIDDIYRAAGLRPRGS